MLRLKIRTHTWTNTIEVDPSTRVGVFLVSFIKKMGYPFREIGGKPLSYQLRLASASERMLPYGMSFAELQIPQDSVLVLNTPDAQTVTIPINPKTSSSKGWLKRRSFLLASIYAAFSVSGLGLGATTEIILRTAHAIGNGESTPLQSTKSQGIPTTAVKMLTFTRHQGLVRTLTWSKDGLVLASGSDDTNVLIWAPDGIVHHELPHLAPVLAAAWAPDGQRLAVGSGKEITFWEATTGTILYRSSGPHTAPITSLAWASTGQMQVVSGSQDTRATVWATENANYRTKTVFTHHTSSIESVSFASDGQSVASSSQGGLTRIWSSTNGQELHGFYQPVQKASRATHFSPVNFRIAIGSDDGHIYLWDNGLECNQQSQGNFGVQCMIAPNSLLAHTKPVRAVAWSPSGKLLASGGEDGLLVIWAPSISLFPLFTVQLPNGLHSLAWGNSDQQIATASGKTVNVWALQ